MGIQMAWQGLSVAQAPGASCLSILTANDEEAMQNLAELPMVELI